ncbi:Hypothetical protein D9617_77g092360 [Elsinoe fawcettii]|nr:Hypothetical protein D9617_77g092360 [Elsinoe fawcettii]
MVRHITTLLTQRPPKSDADISYTSLDLAPRPAAGKHTELDASETSQVQLPSPSPTKLEQDSCESTLYLDVELNSQPRKRTRLLSDGVRAEGKLAWWLSTSEQEEDFRQTAPDATFDDMDRPSPKRSRSESDTFADTLSPSGDGTDTSLSQGRKYSLYQSANYPTVLETKGSYMRASDSGMVEQDWELCKTLLTSTQELERDILFDLHFEKFHANLRGRSEARICTDLHPRLAPSVENLFIAGRTSFGALVEGYNDAWLKSVPFYGPRPQPDHTYGFRWDCFSQLQRRKLKIDPQQKSLYTAREDIYFPYLTAEVKCGRQGLDLAERPNMHSMTVAMRGVVDLYRRAGRTEEVHRRVLGFTISHDDAIERIHAYYPEINGDETTYWRKVIKEFAIGSHNGEQRWASYRFTLNVCEIFALRLLEQLKRVINELPDPQADSSQLSTNSEEYSVLSSQEDTVAQERKRRKQSSAGGLGAELRNTIQILQQQLGDQQKKTEEQQEKAEEQQNRLQRQLEAQQEKAEEQQNRLQRQLEDQQKKSEEQQNQLQRQLEDLMAILKEQRR